MDAVAYRAFLELEERHWWMRGRRSVYLGLLAHSLGGARVRRALDLGAGMGAFLPGLSQIAEQVVYTDVSSEGVATCRERGFTRGALASGYSLPFADASFGLVCMFDAIEHIEDDARAMREVARILEPGGRVFVSVPAYQFLYANNDRIAQHFRRYTRGSLRRVFEQAGLVVERNTHANVFLFPAILPAVLGIKLVEKVLVKDPDPKHTNLSYRMPGPLNEALYRTFAAELPLSRRFDWPIGHSIAALARKR
ncbi:MAG: class I SAM-dependent methyltransferase [Planctomycetota bacterium]|nr:MAG: class I SAM-dependent methyltransferase [Planctomycetota bacterium]